MTVQHNSGWEPDYGTPPTDEYADQGPMAVVAISLVIVLAIISYVAYMFGLWIAGGSS